MVEVSAALVKELRGRTGAGMMNCKKALTESNGDLDAAADWLRTKGLAAAAQRAARVAAEGLIGVAASDSAAAMVEVNSETDFVARNELMQGLVRTLANLALQCQQSESSAPTREDLLAAEYPEAGRSVADQITHLVATIGENIALRRVASLSVTPGCVATYVHGALVPGLGRIGVLVALKSSAGGDELAAFGRQLAMHIAAANPQAVTAADIDPQLVERERAVLAAQAADSGKDAAIVQQMVEGRLRKYYEEVALMEQTYVIDGERKVSKVVEAVAQTVGASVELVGFTRYALGEGIERMEADFASDVAAQSGA